MQATSRQLAFTLLVLLGINTMNFYDRQVLGAVGEIVRHEWKLNDRDLSALTIAFILLYAAVGLPLGHWADVGRRKVILAVGVLVWSVMTGLSGLAWNFASLFVFRLAVGVGEASCAPAANSLLGDLFPKEQRARALSVFMLGLPLGLGMSYIVSGLIAQALTWQWALFVAGVPGLILGVLALWLPEPERGAAEQQSPPRDPRHESAIMVAKPREALLTTGQPDSDPRRRAAILAVLRMPTMWWIILSGALLNLNMYALGSFLTSFLMRYHHLGPRDANVISGLVYGFGGSVGLLWGGWLCDRIVRKRADGRLQLAAVAMLLGAPCLWLALQQERGDWFGFAAWLLPGCVCLYFYYASVYATIADIVPPTLRGTAMAVYFFVFYLFAAVGLYAFGWLSDHLRGLAEAAGSPESEARALGLHGALHVVPALTLALVVVLLAAARTIPKDHGRQPVG